MPSSVRMSSDASGQVQVSVEIPNKDAQVLDLVGLRWIAHFAQPLVAAAVSLSRDATTDQIEPLLLAARADHLPIGWIDKHDFINW